MMKNIFKKFDDFIPKDGRWFLGGSHITLCFISFFFYNFHRSLTQIFLAYLFAFTTEIILFKTTKKYQGKSIWDRLFSAATEAAGLIILVKSGHMFFYGITSSIAVASKYFFRVNEKRHLYNPTNFAIVAGLCLFPQTTFNLLGDEFTVSAYPLFHVTILGILAVWRGNTWQVTLGYLATVIINALVMGYIFADSFLYWLGPEVGAIGLIFMFLMITDPKTTPKSSWGKFAFGAAIAAMKIILKYNEIIYPHFIAAFIITLLGGAYYFFQETIKVELGKHPKALLEKSPS